MSRILFTGDNVGKLNVRQFSHVLDNPSQCYKFYWLEAILELLSETPDNLTIRFEDIIDKMKERAYTPILAHPERYQYMDIGDYRHWKERGMLFQLNVPSLVGAYGPDVQKKAEMLLKRGMYNLCGTDTHSIRFADYFLHSKINKKISRNLEDYLDVSIQISTFVPEK